MKTILNREENELVWQLYEVTYTFVGDRQALEAEIAKRTGKDPASVSTMASALIEIFDGCD